MYIYKLFFLHIVDKFFKVLYEDIQHFKSNICRTGRRVNNFWLILIKNKLQPTKEKV